MPPRRAKGKASATTVPLGQKRRAEDASDAPKNAPPAKKARQNAPKAAPAKVVPAAEVIELSSDEEGSATEKKPVSAAVDDDSDNESQEMSDEDEPEDAAEEDGEDEDGNPRLPQKVRERLDYIVTHTDGPTSTYLKFITKELPNYMGRGGSNADVAANIANHCAFQAQLGRSDLAVERRLVKRVHGMCYGGCGESEDDDDYEVPQEILDRLVYCLHMLEGFDLKALRTVIKSLPRYKGRRKGELDDVLEDVMAHLDVMAAKKADAVAETAMIEKIKEKAGGKAKE
ncbi:hypothetical protein B0H16DRAFT_402804 [Mycena metata]|uniref:Uncharacterized protein n=1 Tax=Mycena metata TaxID=1033252 RepID=A0AAD7NKP2_9AGAR|nr:hypothetical protein B0H16DRAFT_402804 [Mycena metata]